MSVAPAQVREAEIEVAQRDANRDVHDADRGATERCGFAFEKVHARTRFSQRRACQRMSGDWGMSLAPVWSPSR